MTVSRPLLAGLLLVALFFAGVVTGGALVLLGGNAVRAPGEAPGPRPPFPPPGPLGGPPPERLVAMLGERLRLDDGQRERAEQIIVEQQAEAERAAASARPQIEAALAHGEERLRAILRPEQLPAFEALTRERKERFGAPPPFPPGPPPFPPGPPPPGPPM